MSRRTALAEQARAGARHAQDVMGAVALRAGGPVVDVTGHPAIARVLREFRGRLALGLLDACPHVSSPQPLLWRPWRPDDLVCAPCAYVEGPEPIAGTDEDHRCEACGRIDRRGRAACAQLGAVIVPLKLCRGCLGDAAS